MTGRVAGKIALVTGGAKGLGEADASALAAEGAKVVLTDLDEEAGQAVADDIGSVFKAQDVTDEARWQEIIGYAGAKGAAEGMSRAIAAHCLESGYKIRCNSIHPGTIDTPMVQNFWAAGRGSRNNHSWAGRRTRPCASWRTWPSAQHRQCGGVSGIGRVCVHHGAGVCR